MIAWLVPGVLWPILAMQNGWQRVASGEPPARIISAMAYDSARQTMVLFAGDRMRSTPTGDTWEWNGARWTQRDTSGPGPRYGHVAAWDPATRGVLAFGGFDKQSQMFADTWLWKDLAWRRLAPAGPPARRSPGFAYDPLRHRTVLFGGFAGVPDRSRPNPWEGQEHRFLQDTWTWDGSSWVRQATEGPEPRYGPGMAWDPVRREVLLFGGNDHAGHFYPETWTWNGLSWSRIADTGPSPRGVPIMVSVNDPPAVFLFGGLADNQWVRDTWKWDGNAWRELSGAPTLPGLDVSAAALDPVRRRVVLFGQTEAQPPVSETWELDLAELR